MKPPLDLRLLVTFVHAVRSGSLSAAAVQVGRTQSAVTMQMQRLEEIVGQDLLYRGGSGVRLTGNGERFLEYAERILSIHDEAITAFSGGGLRGSIVFGCPEDYLVSTFPSLLQSFGRTHPDVEIKVVAASTDQLRKLLHSKQVDLALVSMSSWADSHDVVWTEALVWVGRQPTFELCNFGDTVPLALSASNTIDHKAACEAMVRVGQRYRISYASNSLAGLVAVTRSGLAVSVMTEQAVPSDLHVLGNPLPALPSLGISLAFTESDQSPATKAFAQHIRRVLRRAA
ncbi:LysR family transcriptional regulator [Phyllobacterium myrsinacearum]|uniref:DNA-binding transcriptional LysR family regulator n=1 Tax=Phyllobacterium myrsinacearum TaxID=28101 RepID=A0A839ERE4_9HYPH|nr:LysR family transcriptional regulator [Phyllobacterium myrsinacearum]MBA8879007.1 DNA-binding transcriptional LysR family regulator [Phyllobacterium myrsinacearum]